VEQVKVLTPNAVFNGTVKTNKSLMYSAIASSYYAVTASLGALPVLACAQLPGDGLLEFRI